MKLETDEEIRRFWSYVVVDCACDCWVWVGYKDKGRFGGYGKVKLRGRLSLAHRVSYETWVGDTGGFGLDHLCRNRACVNPWHVEPVEHRVNVLRGVSFAAENARRSTCSRGHPLDGPMADLMPNKRGRICRICNVERAREQRAKKRPLAF